MLPFTKPQTSILIIHSSTCLCFQNYKSYRYFLQYIPITTWRTTRKWVALHWHMWWHSLGTEERKAKLLSLPRANSYSDGQTTLAVHSPQERKKIKCPQSAPVWIWKWNKSESWWSLLSLRVLVFKDAMFRYHFNMLSFLSAGVLWKALGSLHKLGAALNICGFPLKTSHYLNALNVSTVQTEMWLPAARLLLNHTTQLLVFPPQPQLFWLLHQHHRKWIIYTTYWI